VDNFASLTDVYAALLEPKGYDVKTFNHRGKALAGLKSESTKPGLLITDYLGASMPVCDFLKAFRLIAPHVRILMASGLDPAQMCFSRIRPDSFLPKPFDPEELLHAVSTVLT